MAVKILLIVSVLLQLFATVIAIRLVRKTKYNVVWILFIVALLLTTASRVLMFVHYAPKGELSPWLIALIWLGIAISVCITLILFYADKLVGYIDKLIFQRALTSKRILSTVLVTEERERTRFSKELHDGLGPLLSSAKMSLSALRTEGQCATNLEILEGAGYVIDEAIRSLREISNNLSPHVLGEFGLGKGVGNFIERCSGIHDMKISYRTNLRNERFDTDVEVILYRVVCELINNSLKHSGASEASLSIDFTGDSVTMEYSDNGRGFSPHTDGASGMGLANIASRINTLGGRLDISSAKDEGMKARVEIDLRRTNHAH
jgi:signal transduction histidine kinase